MIGQPRRLAIVTALILGIAACSSDPSGPSGPSMAGTWQVDLNFSGQERASGAPTWRTMSCAGTITTTFKDQAGTITGAFTAGNLSCSFDGQAPNPLPWRDSLSGSRTGANVTFSDSFCTYAGGIDNAKLAGGTMDCVTDDGITELNTHGIWEATK